MTSAIPAAKPIVGEDEVEAVSQVLRSGSLAQGEQVAAFEAEFSLAVAGRECIAVNSGTSALHLALLAAGIGAGDEVIVPSFTFAATANAVALAGATPVFADIDPATYCINADSVESALTSKTRAIMPVHLYGHPAAMDRLVALASSRDLLVIEDAAQAHLASLNCTPVGAFGIAGCFSFYPTKNMTSGEGGMVTTSSEDVARQVRLLRNQGMEVRYQNEVVGFNSRMSDVHAAIGRVQFSKLAKWTRRRRDIAHRYDEGLSGVVTPAVAPGAEHVYHQYTIRIEGGNRDAVAAGLAERGVRSGVYYPTPVHQLPSFGLDLDLPNTRLACEEVLSLPVHPSLTDAEVDRVIESVNDEVSTQS